VTETCHRQFALLELEPGCTFADARAAYRRLAKRNHPDLVPDAERPTRQLAMMRINEAYMAVMAELSEQGGRWDGAHDASGAPTGGSCRGGFQDDAGATDGDMGPQSASSGDSGAFFSAWSGKARAGAPSSSTDVGPLRDPAYAYYKQGFRYFNRGATELSRKEAPDLRRALLRERTPRAYDAYVLRFALRALHYFERSYSYFLVVVDRYPASPWYADAKWKLRRIEKFTAIYQRICENLSRRSSTSRSSFSIVKGADPS
jgi:curved DNA-binding protein CbpA